MTLEKTQSRFSTLNEKALHAELKALYAQAGGTAVETEVEGFIVDVIQGDLLVEIQTGSFSGIRRKLTQLAGSHRVRLVYPVARDKWIIKQTAEGEAHSRRRKSPKRGRVEDVFLELVSLPKLLAEENFSLEVLLIQEEEIRRPNRRKGWRRKEWMTHERRLLCVLERWLFETPAALGSLLPGTLSNTFSTADLAAALAMPRWLAQKMAYCLRETGVIESTGKKGNNVIYQRTAQALPCRARRKRPTMPTG